MQHSQSMVVFLDFLIFWQCERFATSIDEQKMAFRNKDAFDFISFAVITWIDVFVRIAYKQALIDFGNIVKLIKGLKFMDGV